MKNRFAFAFLAAMSLVSVAGCPKKPAGDDMGPAIAKLNDIRDQMCKCTDKACADKVNEAYAKWGQEQAKTAPADKNAVANQEQANKIVAISEEITKCTAKAIAGAAAMPAGEPAAPAAPAAPAGDKPADPSAAP
ncbi:MAG TPA: hypothetical protein VFP84_08305, partial [Kofleriaceae bacterium]|nr:hypothetical protein [Kofleriaceae bacterium]